MSPPSRSRTPPRVVRSSTASRAAGNLGSVLATLQERHPDDFELLEAELVRMMPEYAALVLLEPEPGTVEIALSLQGESSIIPAENLSQGTLSEYFIWS